MINTLQCIQKYVLDCHAIKINESLTNKSIIHYDLFNKKADMVGYLQLTHADRLKTFRYTGNPYKIKRPSLDENEILEITEVFIKTIYKNENLIFRSILVDENNYQVIYEVKESKYNLNLPETGIKIKLNLSGQILEVESKIDNYKVIYPKNVISEDEAKMIYLKSLNLDLKISKLSDHLQYQLYYRINEMMTHVFASGGSGNIISHKQNLKSLEPFETSSKNLFRVLGLNDDYKKIGKRSKRNYRIELWSKLRKKDLFPLDYNINNSQQGIIKYKINKHTNQIVQITNGEILDQTYNQKISEKEAFNCALDYLFTVYPNADELFDLIDSKRESENEKDLKYEPNYLFYFNRIHDSIEIENLITYIGVGKYTKMINEYCATNITNKELQHINVFAKVSESKAKKIYEQDLKMKLVFKKKEKESKEVVYELIYQPLFSKGKLNANLIDAHNGVLYES